MMRDLVIATRNPGKLKEIREILKDVPFNVLGLDTFPDAPEVVENLITFAGNCSLRVLLSIQAVVLFFKY